MIHKLILSILAVSVTSTFAADKTLFTISCAPTVSVPGSSDYKIKRFESANEDGSTTQKLEVSMVKGSTSIAALVGFSPIQVPITHDGSLIYTQPLVDRNGRDAGYLHLYHSGLTSIVDLHIHGGNGFQTGTLKNYKCEMTK